MPVVHLLVYSFTLWFGLYLLARNTEKSGLRYAGLGLVSYAFSIMLALFLADTPQWLRLPVMLPALFWLGATFHLLPDRPISETERVLLRLAWPYTLVVFVAGFANDALSRWMSLVVPLFLLAGMVLRMRQIAQLKQPKPPLLIMGTALLFFLMASSLILLPQDWLRQDWVALTISIDMLLLGWAVAMLDAYDEGISLRRDSLRALAAAAVALVFVVGQVVLVSAVLGTSPTLDALAFGLITVVLLWLSFYDRLQTRLDTLVLGAAAVRYREDLRSVSSAVLRQPEESVLAQLDAAEFSRVTRRALSAYGDLNKLAASPLMQLDCLRPHAALLERAQALKALLKERVEQLKPDTAEEFAAQDEWRYYNVLYFPYIRGLKPYSVRVFDETLTDAERQAAAWFRAVVPERTLYNWQKSAADLVAQSLRNPAFSEKQAYTS